VHQEYCVIIEYLSS